MLKIIKKRRKKRQQNKPMIVGAPGQHQSEQLEAPARLPQASHRGRGGSGVEHG